MSTGRFKDISWNLANSDGKIASWEMVVIAVMMDVRDELKRLNSLLYCHNFTGIPQTLRKVEKNTRKKKRAAPARKLRVA